MEIHRDLYLSKLLLRKHNTLIKVITGVRRCGKSFLLSTIFKRHLMANGVKEDHIVEVAFDDKESEQYRNPDTFYNYAKSRLADSEMHYFLLDEVQLLGDFEAVLNGLMRRKNADIYVTGSNAKFLSKDVITEFRGRGDEIHMQPLTFSEFMSIYTGDRLQGLDEYLTYGGIPIVVLEADLNQKIEILKTLFSETYITDIITRHKLRKLGEMEDLLNILSSNIGTLTNPNKLEAAFHSKKKSSITSTTIARYLDYLEEAYLIERARRYDVKGKAYIETPVKYYYSDLGLRNARINFRQLEATHGIENVIYNELRSRVYNVDIGVVPITERNKNGIPLHKQLEVDFIANKGSRRYYIQSAYMIPDAAKLEQESRSLRKIDDSFKKIIVTYNAPSPQYNDDGILVMSIFEFLLNPNSLDL